MFHRKNVKVFCEFVLPVLSTILALLFPSPDVSRLLSLSWIADILSDASLSAIDSQKRVMNFIDAEGV